MACITFLSSFKKTIKITNLSFAYTNEKETYFQYSKSSKYLGSIETKIVVLKTFIKK